MRFRYCPYCGQLLVKKEIGDEGQIPFCTKCSIPLWDLFTTAVIVACVNECGEIALIRQGYVSETNHVCIAGIMKPGESAEETVAREVKEEIGVDVKSVTYIKSYPFEKKEMLMLGFKATAPKAEFKLSGEVDSAQWVKFEDALPFLKTGSIAWQLVDAVIHGETEKGAAQWNNLASSF